MQAAKSVDFVVVGSGIAGLNTALTLAPFGKVLIITKNKPHISSTALAQGGIAAVIKKDDSLTSHKNDTLAAGYQHNKKTAVNVLVKGGKNAVEKLEQLGVLFDREENGDYVSSFEAAHSYPRILHATDFTGREIENALLKTINKQPAIEMWEDTMAVDLIVKDNQCFGLQVLKNNSIINLYSRAVILATGGIGQLYQWTTNPVVSTGDGIAIAYSVGAKLTDLEFIQFHPTALKENESPLLLLSEALRGEGALLINSNHERFMKKIHPMAELAPRDVVARAIFSQQKNGEVFLDISHKKRTFLQKRFPNLLRELQKRGYDLTSQPIPVTPAVHFLCGGITTDTYGRTSLKNLFAYGEVAATGVHGANRLASNSLLEGMAFSKRIKYCIDELPKNPRVINVNKKTLVPSPYHLVPEKIKTRIRSIMWHYVGIVRNVKGLKTAEKELKELQSELGKQNGINASILETHNMLTVGLLVIKAAQKRKKSLGTHYII